MKVKDTHRKFWEVIRERTNRWASDADQKLADWACNNVEKIFSTIEPQNADHAATIANECVNYLSSSSFNGFPSVDGFARYYNMND